VRIISPAKRPVPSQFFERVGEALSRRRRLRMRYLTRGRGTVSQREVSPQRLVHHRNTWYLDAWCHSRERLLRFALDAIEEATALDMPARELPLEQVEAAMDAGYGIYAGAERQWARIRVTPTAAQWISREQWHPDQRGRWLDDGRYEFEVPFSDETEIAMDILRQGDRVEVLGPESLVAEVRRRLQAAAAQYRRPDAAPGAAHGYEAWAGDEG
jgi:predicted DNA-binding transcriptional regulator YafY